MSESDATTVPPESVAEECSCASPCKTTNHNVFIRNIGHDPRYRDLKSAPNSRAVDDSLTTKNASSSVAASVLHDHERRPPCRELRPSHTEIPTLTTTLPPIRYHEPQHTLPHVHTARGKDAFSSGRAVGITCSSLPSSVMPNTLMKQTVNKAKNNADPVTVAQSLQNTKTLRRVQLLAPDTAQPVLRRNDQPSKGLSQSTITNSKRNIISENASSSHRSPKHGCVHPSTGKETGEDRRHGHGITKCTQKSAATLPAAFFSLKNSPVKPDQRNLHAQEVLLPPLTITKTAASCYRNKDICVAENSNLLPRVRSNTFGADANSSVAKTTVRNNISTSKQDVLSVSRVVSVTNPSRVGQAEVEIVGDETTVPVKNRKQLSLLRACPGAKGTDAECISGGEKAGGTLGVQVSAVRIAAAKEDADSVAQCKTTTPCPDDKPEALPTKADGGKEETKKEDSVSKAHSINFATQSLSALPSTHKPAQDGKASRNNKRPTVKKSGRGRKRKAATGSRGRGRRKRARSERPSSVNEKRTVSLFDEKGVSNFLKQMRVSWDQAPQARSKFLEKDIRVLPKPIREDKTFRETEGVKEAVKEDAVLPSIRGVTTGDSRAHLPGISKELLDLTSKKGEKGNGSHTDGVDSGATGNQGASCEAKRGAEEEGIEERICADTKCEERHLEAYTAKGVECEAQIACPDSNSNNVTLNKVGSGESTGVNEVYEDKQRTLSSPGGGDGIQRRMQLQREVQLLRALVIRKESGCVDTGPTEATTDGVEAKGVLGNGRSAGILRAMRIVRLSHILSTLDVDEVPEEMDRLVAYVSYKRRRETYELSVGEGLQFIEYELSLGEACDKAAESVMHVFDEVVKGGVLELWKKRERNVSAHMSSFNRLLGLIVTRMQGWMRDILRGDGIDASWTETICDRMGGALYGTVRTMGCEEGSKEICGGVCEVLREICDRFERKERGSETMKCDSFCRAYEMSVCLGRRFGRALTMMPAEKLFTIGRHVRVFAERVAEMQVDGRGDRK